jgi:hypothetical protein
MKMRHSIRNHWDPPRIRIRVRILGWICFRIRMKQMESGNTAQAPNSSNRYPTRLCLCSQYFPSPKLSHPDNYAYFVSILLLFNNYLLPLFIILIIFYICTSGFLGYFSRFSHFCTGTGAKNARHMKVVPLSILLYPQWQSLALPISQQWWLARPFPYVFLLCSRVTVVLCFLLKGKFHQKSVQERQ